MATSWWPWGRLKGDADRVEQGRRSRLVGRRGERVARRALRRAGYRVLARNVRTPHGEVDIVAIERGVLVVVEVKTTARQDPETAPAGVAAAQARRLGRAAHWIAGRSASYHRVRRDLVLVRLARPRARVRIVRGGF